MPTTGERFERAVEIMERLRAPGGCPWDREQTFDSIKPYTLEEAYEVLEAIDDRDWPELTGELGDLLLQVLFYSTMAREVALSSGFEAAVSDELIVAPECGVASPPSRDPPQLQASVGAPRERAKA